MIGQSEPGNSSQIIFIALSLAGAPLCCVPITSLSKLCKIDGPKPFC